MAMVVTNWQDHNIMPQPSDDISGLHNLASNATDTVHSPTHQSNLIHTSIQSASSGSIQGLHSEPSLTPISQPQSPTSSRNGSVSDGSCTLTTLGEMSIPTHTSSSPCNRVDKPHIDCVVSVYLLSQIF